MVTTDQLRNKSAANMKLRPFLEREVLLGAFNIYGDMLQCLSAVQFLLNGKGLTCKPLETFDLPPEYEVQFDGKRLVHHIMVKRGQMLAKEWLSHYNFPQPQARFDVGTNYVYAIHPVIDRFLFTESGNIAVANVGLLSGGTVLLLAFCRLLCSICCPSCRQCGLGACSSITNSIYRGCTSEAFRLRKENRKLRRTNKKSRKTLEKSMEEYRLVNRALRALEVDVEEDSDVEMEDFQAKDLERADDDKLRPLH